MINTGIVFIIIDFIGLPATPSDHRAKCGRRVVSVVRGNSRGLVRSLKRPLVPSSNTSPDQSERAAQLPAPPTPPAPRSIHGDDNSGVPRTPRRPGADRDSPIARLLAQRCGHHGKRPRARCRAWSNWRRPAGASALWKSSMLATRSPFTAVITSPTCSPEARSNTLVTRAPAGWWNRRSPSACRDGPCPCWPAAGASPSTPDWTEWRNRGRCCRRPIPAGWD